MKINSLRPIPQILRQKNNNSEQQPRIRVSVLFIDNNSVLLLKSIINKKKVWFLPGGSLKWGESLTRAAKREIKEELGCQITVIRILALINIIALSKNYHGLEIILLGKLKSKIKFTNESLLPGEKTTNCYSIQAKWLNLSQLNKANIFPKKLIKKILKNHMKQKKVTQDMHFEEEIVK